MPRNMQPWESLPGRKAQHTPGPYPVIAFVSDDGGQTPLWNGASSAKIHDSFGEAEERERCEDAGLTLVSVPMRQAFAAPDLLAALKWLADAASASSESPEARDWHFKDVQHGIEIARAAIAKARGQ